MKLSIKNYKILIYLIFLSVSFVSGKWIFAYLFFPNEDIINKIIFEIYDFQYFPLIHNLRNLDFNPSYSLSNETLKFIPIPYSALIFHAVFIKIFGYSGFILLEFLSVFIFLYIFFLIFKKINFSNSVSLLLSALIFALPSLTSLFEVLNFPHLESMHLANFYSLRIPRPMISNLYLFAFFYLLIQFYKGKKQNNFFAICFTLLLALMWASFFHNFVISIIALTIVIILNYKSQLFDNLLKNYKLIVLLIFYFIIFSIPLFIILHLSEPDYSARVGLIELDFNKKKILLNHFFKGIVSNNFFLIFALNTLTLWFIKRKQNFYCSKSIEIFYILFISSVLSPFLFILFSPVIGSTYHFANLVVIMGLIYFFISSLVITATLFNKLFEKNELHFLENKILRLFFIVFFILFYNYQIFLHGKEKNKLFFHRSDFSEVTSEMKKNNIKSPQELNILAFSDIFQTWFILSDYKYLSIIHNIYSPRKDNVQEDRMIYTFKFLKLNVNDFLNFFENKKQGHRYLNFNVARYLGYMKYQANSLKTFNDSKNFDGSLKNFILNSSPLYMEQLAIPKKEFERLRKKFLQRNTFKFKEPDLIIFNKFEDTLIFKRAIVDTDKFCILINNNSYMVYIKNNKIKNCK